MKTVQSFVTALTITGLSANSAFAAGVGSSGGGKAVVCRSAADQAIESATVLDLYEAVHQHGLQLRPAIGSTEDELMRVLAEFRNSTENTPDSWSNQNLMKANKIIRNFQLTPGVLKSIADVGNTIALPRECSLEQLAIYQDKTEKLSVNLDIWNALDSMNQAALLAHEVIYRQQRIDGGDTTSEVTRRMVGLLFSTTPPPAKRTLLLDDTPFCVSSDNVSQRRTHFYVSSQPSTRESTLTFDVLGGRQSIPVSVTLPVIINPAALHIVNNRAIVGDENANHEVGSTIQNPPFEGFRVFVTYKYNEPFLINILDPQNKPVTNGAVQFCQQN